MAAIMGGGKVERPPRKKYYKDQGGWVGNTSGGVKRDFFVFSDSLEVGRCVYAGGGEGLICPYLTAAQLVMYLPTKWFAGIVCVAN